MGRISRPWYWEQGDAWCVEIRRKRHVLAKGKASKAAAHDEFHRLMVSLGKRDPIGRVYRPTVEELFEEFLGREGLAPTTYEGYVQFLSSASAQFGKSLAEQLAPHQVHLWVESKDHQWGPTTRANAITAVKAAYRWAKRRGLIASNPVEDMEKPTRQRREAVLTDAQIGAVLAETAGTPFADLITALWESGCRPGEVTTLLIDHVDLEKGVWQVRNKTRKKTGQEFRTVYLTPALIELSRRLIGGRTCGLVFRNARRGEWTRNAQACAWRRIRPQLGLGAEATSYAIRHRYAMEGLRQGLDASEVAALMGHSDVKMINTIYGHWDQQHERLKAAAQRVRPAAPASPSAASGASGVPPGSMGETPPLADS